MKHSQTLHRFGALFRGAALTLSMLVVGNVVGNVHPASAFGDFSFDYAVDGDAAVRPVQVFDNGRVTFFQFRRESQIPAIFTANGELAEASVSGQYVVVQSTHRAYTLILGAARAGVVHSTMAAQVAAQKASGATPPRMGDAAALQVPQPPNLVPRDPRAGPSADERLRQPPDWLRNSYAVPVRGDAIRWVESQAPTELVAVPFVLGSAKPAAGGIKLIDRSMTLLRSAATVEIIGRDDNSQREGLAQARTDVLRQALINAGVNPRVIVERPGPALGDAVRSGAEQVVQSHLRVIQHAAPIPLPVKMDPAIAVQGPQKRVTWDIKVGDKTVDQALVRWAGEAGWTVVWEAKAKPVLTGDVVIQASTFLDAADQVITGLKEAGYPVRAVSYANKVIRVLPVESTP